jgi:hypothetical protein
VPTLLIGYDLNRPGQRYNDLIDAIKSLGTWWHYLDSTWIVDTQLHAPQVRDRLSGKIDDDDELLVVDVTNQNWASRGLPQPANAWLSRHVAA